jgi:hypothetical protein
MCMLSLFYQLPNCNLFTHHVIYLYGETPLVNYGPRSILLHSYYRLCHGDDLWGMPCAELFAGWHPRSLHGSKTRRPAPPGGPAVPTAGWRFHCGRPEPGDEDKSPPTVVSPKVGWPRQERQGLRMGVTSATTKSSQSATKDPSPR